MDRLRQEMIAYYRPLRQGQLETLPAAQRALRANILAAMDRYADDHPDCHPSQLKARLHEEMAERFEPMLFPHSPFFFEMGLRPAENWGCPWPDPQHIPGSWLLHRRQPEVYARPEHDYIQQFQYYTGRGQLGLWGVWGGFDVDHHSLGYTQLFRTGVNGLLAEIAARQGQPCTAHEAANLEAMARSARAVLRVAARFAEHARALLSGETDPEACRFLTMIAETAGRIPAEPPQTFYEGLAMLYFLREVTATLEAIGVSVLGHLDRLLGPLYAADLAAGRLTEADARDLLARWMLPTDIRFFVEESGWPETSTCITLGGCDEDGRPVWNDVTRLVIEVHHAHHLLNPKLNCRYSAASPQPYLDLISATTLAGHNHFALLNDDVLIPAVVRAGKTEREARLYVNGGCQETIVEGVEHSAGAYYYFSMPRALDLCLQPPDRLPDGLSPASAQAIPPVIDAPASFEEFYQAYMARLMATIRTGAEWMVALGQDHWQRHPCPFFSTTLEGCIARGMDYTQGGAKYNPSGIALVGLGTVVDALYALKTAVFDEGWLSYAAMQHCLATDWAGEEELRLRLQRLPKFGQGHAEVDALAARYADTLAQFVRTMPTERGGIFQGSFFVYYAFEWFAPHVRALPQGKRPGELLTQGIAPHRAAAPASLTDTFHSLAGIDFRDFPANCVLDVQLPLGDAMPPQTLSAVLRTFATLGGPTLQPNCVSVAALRDAQAHPEQHRDLVVRISGLSAHFVSLQPHVQEEIISRAMMAV